MKLLIVLCAVISFSIESFAHDNVHNEAVKTRMKAMQELASSMKVFGQISKGKRVFDTSEARAIASQIVKIASQTPSLFEGEESDPNSKAKPEIWFEFKDFSFKASQLEQVAAKLSNTISNSQDIKPAMREIGSACKGCHTLYKE